MEEVWTVLNKEEILDKIEEHLKAQTEEKNGGSGHLSNISISDISIDEIKETSKQLEVTFSYTVDILSEFTIAEDPDPTKEPDPYDPYHYRKTEKITLKT
jgi:hypothetical protein